MGDTDEEAHDGDSLVRLAVEVGNFSRTSEGVVERNERAFLLVEPANWYPRVIDEIKVGHFL